ncbi:MAG: TIGR02444 family protein [Alphaproteobacteria bacterium]|tara:strand:+ start:246 stop:815 length:570 start_codon:yes stop_codon:yes gene_type:complete
MSLVFEECSFWDFSLQVYSCEGVSAACIGLQDRHILDVNIILLSMWLGHNGHPIMDNNALNRALDTSRRWNKDIICGVRAVRLALKDDFSPIAADNCEALRKSILSLEIEGEHLEQLALASTVISKPNPELEPALRLAICTANLGLYLTELGAKLDEQDYVDFRVIFAATFPDLDEEVLDFAMQSFAAI